MATLKVTVGQVNITEHLKFRMREVESPLTEVYSQLFEPPHTSTRIFTTSQLNPVNHYVDWYKSNAGGDLLELIHTTEVDLTIQETLAIGFLEFIVNGLRGAPYYDPSSDPDNGTPNTIYDNPDLAGKTVDDYIVFKTGYGPLSWDFDIAIRPEGGFELINDLIFFPGERYLLLFNKKQNVAAAPSGTARVVNDIVLVDANLPLTATHYNSMMAFNFAGNAGVITVGDMDTIPNMTRFLFNTHQGNQINGEIAFQSGQFVQFKGEQLNKIYLGVGEELEIIIKEGIAYVLPGFTGYNKLGNRELTDVVGVNQLLLDGSGPTLDGNVYKRLWWWLENKLPAPQKKTVAERSILKLYSYTVKANAGSGTQTITQSVFINRGFWAIDTTSGNKIIYKPDDMNKFYRSVKNTGGSDDQRELNLPGGYQHHAVGPHEQEIFIPGRGSGDGWFTRNDGTGTGLYLKTYGDTGYSESRGVNTGLLPCVNI